MKRSFLLVLAVMTIAAVGLTSYIAGPAHHSGYDCSGSESDFNNPVGCSANNSCHGTVATPAITVAIEVDSAGTPVNKYTGGITYTVKLKGINNIPANTNVLPYFGFQITAITGSTRVVTPTNAGAWQKTGLPSGVQYSPAQPGNYLANVMEHNTAIPATSGSGGPGTVYNVAVNWTAPAAGTGTVSFWAALNATDGIDAASGFLDNWNTQSLVLEEGSSTLSGINAAPDNIAVNIYPNPSSDFVQVEISNAVPGQYKINAYSAEGREVSVNTIEAFGSYANTSINTSAWAPGIYLLQLTNGDQQKIVRLVKR